LEGSPAVTVVVATCGDWSALGASLSSALAQDDVTFEVVVVDRGHAGSPPGFVEGLLADERVRVLSAPNAGEAAARNVGVRAARADTIAFLDATDLWAPAHVAALVGLGEADFAYCASWIVDAGRRIVGFQSVPAPEQLTHELLGRNAIGTPSSVLARRDLWKRAGGFDEWLSVFAPWELWIRWSRAGVASMSSTPTVAARPLTLGTRAARAELRELRRRYGPDARRAGMRFGATPAPVQAPPDGARPPWLVARPDAHARRTAP
jgi:hypothetical protein